MTPETRQVPTGYFRRPRMSPGGAPPGPLPDTQSPETVSPGLRPPGQDTAGWPPSAYPPPPAYPPAYPPSTFVPPPPLESPPPAVAPSARAGNRARQDGSIVAVIPYLAVVLCTVAGVYIAWHQGSAGGGKGGVVGGVALLVAAVMRLVLPARLVGLLGTRNRAIDVLTLTIFGGGLLIAGLVLPR